MYIVPESDMVWHDIINHINIWYSKKQEWSGKGNCDNILDNGPNGTSDGTKKETL